MIPKKQILNSINKFDKSYNQLNNDFNCFTYNLSDFARLNIDNYDCRQDNSFFLPRERSSYIFNSTSSNLSSVNFIFQQYDHTCCNHDQNMICSSIFFG